MNHKLIFTAQAALLSLLWIFVISISRWIIHLLQLSAELHDVPSASVAISLVAIPVFLIIAGVLSYVLVGLWRTQREEQREETDIQEHGKQANE